MSNSRFLYHGTGIYSLASIIETDAMYEGVHWSKPSEPHGPRFSEDYEVAKSYINFHMPWGEGGVIVLDRDAVARDYELVDYQDKRYDGADFGQNEWEVAAITPKISNLSDYLVSVVCDPRVIHMALKRHNMEYSHDESSGWVHGWGSPYKAPGRRNMLRAFDELTASQFLNSDAFEPESSPVTGNWLEVPIPEPSYGMHP
jgi:hypothetical protein